ncbi:MAG: Glu-tRNA(Gln) amidotransferase subunit GatE [Candidatus Bathyarchaeota archaeon]|nr:MAG: Glu-tRNA(Gln) amidotransferase subunit GatE [Candidatus Bathyarchaeota archaeon]
MTASFEKLGLKVGLEIHRQLDTKTKLFCDCKPKLFKEDPKIVFLRRLRPTQSELGQIDPAALFEFQKGVKMLYEANEEASCLVEMDEEPPHNLDREAVEIALTIALMMNAKPVDEIHVMRKAVIDGSNTTGFQRTCVVALSGELDLKGKHIPIQHVSLEEDAARRMEENGSIIHYRIDRLGIPLIEIATAPVICTPQETEEVALAIGRILRATGKVKRGLGTIRQDLNVSIQDGALIEIKGVQELRLVSRIVEFEVQRQLGLLKIRDELKERGASKDDVEEEIVDVSSVFEQTKCRVIRKVLNQDNRVLAVRLPKFAGLLGRELVHGMRLGSEMASIAHFWGRVGGLFHTDELPAYGITDEEVSQLRQCMNAEPQDAVVLVADARENATDALKAVIRRATEALGNIPEETRGANPDGTSRYLRPRPGAARMYPETDVPPIQLSNKHIEEMRACLPESAEEKMSRLMREYGLNMKLAKQILESKYVDLFRDVVEETTVHATVVAVTLTETLKALKRDGVEVDNVTDNQLKRLFGLVGSGHLTKEAIADVLTWLVEHKDAGVEDAIKNLELVVLSREELETVVARLIEDNKKLVEERRMDALGVLMGFIMKSFRGRVKVELVDEVLRKRLKENLSHT